MKFPSDEKVPLPFFFHRNRALQDSLIADA